MNYKLYNFIIYCIIIIIHYIQTNNDQLLKKTTLETII